jgi:predicted Rossmann fold flavoprotein
LRLSAWGARVLKEINYSGDAIVNFVPAYNTESIRANLQQQRHIRSQQAIGNKNPYNLPQRLWSFLLESSDVDPSVRWRELSSKSLNRLADMICRFVLPVKGKTTFKEEFVTAGGIMTAEIEPQTMQSRKVPGLYFAGEILDVDGITGGYNFQHAWTSGFLAAASIARMANEKGEDRDS